MSKLEGDVAIAGGFLFANPMFIHFLEGSTVNHKTAILSLISVTIYKFLQVIPKQYESATWYLIKNNFSLHPDRIKKQVTIKNWGLINSIEQSMETLVFLTVTTIVNLSMGFNYLVGADLFLILGGLGCLTMFGAKMVYFFSKSKR